MAHLVEQMAYVGHTPWHGIGNRLEEKQPLEVWAKQAGMNWQIQESPVHFITNDRFDSLAVFPEQKVLYRSDTKAALSVVSNRYQVVQPHDILEFYRDLTDVSGFDLETAGVLKGGRKLWALARTGQSATLKGNDVINGYLLLATACDGTLATTAQFTSVRVVCNNTLAVAVANAVGAVKVSHSTAFDPEAVKKQLGISVSSWDGFMCQMKALSERKVKSLEMQRFIESVFAQPGISTTSAEWATKRVQALFEGHGKGAELASSKGTAFGLLNAVTQFIDHERRARSADNRLDSAWFGKGAVIKQKALDQALQLVA